MARGDVAAALYLAAHGFSVNAVDISPRLAAFAQQQAVSIKTHTVDLDESNKLLALFGRESLDCVVMTHYKSSVQLLVVIGELLGVGVSWFLMAKKFKQLSDSYNSITIPDFFESHFKPKTHLLRIVAATALSVFVIIYVSAQIDVTGKAFESFLGINYFTGAVVGFLIVLAYIFTGGFVAVVWSDFFQGLLMFFGLVALPIVAYWGISNGSEIVSGLNDIDPGLTTVFGGGDDTWMKIASMLGFAMIGLGFLGSPQIYVRFMSIKSMEEINKGRWVAIVFTLLTDAAAVSIGVLARYIFTKTGQDPEAQQQDG